MPRGTGTARDLGWIPIPGDAPDPAPAPPEVWAASRHTETREEIKAHLTCKNTASGEDAVGVAFFIVRKAINTASRLF